MKLKNKMLIPAVTGVYGLYYYIYFQNHKYNKDIYKYI